MPQQQEQVEEQKSAQKNKDQSAPSTLPNALQKRISMKWVTVEALTNVIARLEQTGVAPKVVFLTAGGQIEGRLNELKLSYAESFTSISGNSQLVPDVASMVTHVRSELLRSYEQEEQDLEIVDTAPILSLTEVVVTNSQGQHTQLPQLTLFADQVIGFSLTPLPKMQ